MDPAPTHHYVKLLLALSPPRPLEAAKLILSLSRRAAAGTYKDPEGKSPYQLLGEWLEICEKYPEETGVDAEQSAALREEREKAEKERLFQEGEKVTAGAAATELVRVGENGDAATASTSAAKYDPSVDPLSTELFDVEHIVRNEGIALYKDQAGRLWTGLGTYWIKRGDFDLANDTFEQGLNSVLTLRDFTQIFDAFAEFQEEYLSALMDGLKEEVEEGEEEERKEEEKELEEKMRTFEELMDRRPFLVNEVLLRRNQNDVQEWEKRIALYGDDDEKVRICSPRRFDRTDKSRSLRRTPRHSRRSCPARLPPTIIRSGCTTPSSTRLAAWRAPRSGTFLAHARSLRRQSGSRTNASRSSRRSGASGRRWK